MKNNFNAKKENHLLANSLWLCSPKVTMKILSSLYLAWCLFEFSKALISTILLPTLNHLLPPQHLLWVTNSQGKQNLLNNALFESVQNCKGTLLFGYLISTLCIIFSLFKEPAWNHLCCVLDIHRHLLLTHWSLVFLNCMC